MLQLFFYGYEEELTKIATAGGLNIPAKYVTYN